MAEALVYGLAQEVLKTLASKAFSEIASARGFRTQLEQLKNSIDTIKDVLLDAEERQADDRAVHPWLERLTMVVYAADNLFDELNTLASRKQLMGGNTMSKEVRTFFSSSNQIACPFKFSRKIEAIRRELDDIVKDSCQFQFVRSSLVGGKPGLSKRRNETYSFVKAEEVIGRDGDKKALLDMLIASTSGGDEHKHVVLPVVGMGGMGKTNLAQLIYNDPLVPDLFELRLWVCVSDVFGFDIKGITEKILMCATNSKIQKLDMQQLQGQLQTQVCDKKYFLVLDDVWNEDRDEWLKLRDLLMMGKKGSKILVTTRSRKVAKIMGTLPPYELQGLSEEKSWELFQKMAFEPGQTQQKPHLVQIGKEIVKKCANVPLAIRSLGSLLYGEDDRKWMSFKEKSLARISDGDQLNMMEILKLSYNHLWSPLKNCFAYCALFPKDYEFDKQMLIDLWMAEGFTIVDANDNQGLEEVAEDYFLLLLQRCFFQDIKRDERGAIKSCKIHDLLHDLAQSVAGVKFKFGSLEERNFNGNIVHVSHAGRLASSWEIPKSMLLLKQLRTFLLPEQVVDGSSFSKLVCQQLILRFRCLRVLDLHNLKLRSLPSSIGKLIHLRYLNLSKTPIKELPDTISKLLNLQTLNLNGCWKLRGLPTHIGRLVNLRSLDVGDCERLRKMPSQIGELTQLHTLPLFIANYNRSSLLTRQPSYAKLSDLKQLHNLRGKLHIKVEGAIENATLEAIEANLTCKQLDELKMEFEFQSSTKVVRSRDEAVQEGLIPHSSLRKLEIKFYRGKGFPSWAIGDNLGSRLPNLVEIRLVNCGRGREVPTFSQLPYLKSLHLQCLKSVEYMEEGGIYERSSSSSSSPPSPTQTAAPTSTIFFPSLQVLRLWTMKSLKGWWKEDGEGIFNNSDTSKVASCRQSGKNMLKLSFSKLSTLSIDNCPNLTTLPLCPNVEELTLEQTNERLSVLKIATTSTSSSSSSSDSETGLKLKTLRVDNVQDLISLPKQCLNQLSSLTVWNDSKLESTFSLGGVFRGLSSSLKSLDFGYCIRLRSIGTGLEHLTALEKLVLYGCPKLDLSPKEHQLGEDDMPWKAFGNNLHSLKFYRIKTLASLPSGLRHLANLRSLDLTGNHRLKELPEWISCLSSLVNLRLNSCPKVENLPDGFEKLTALIQLQLYNCPRLIKRCRGPNGRDWPKIKHISFVFLGDDDLVPDETFIRSLVV